jgi:hypothetical protein
MENATGAVSARPYYHEWIGVPYEEKPVTNLAVAKLWTGLPFVFIWASFFDSSMPAQEFRNVREILPARSVHQPLFAVGG